MGCMLGPHDFRFVSGLVFLSKTLWILSHLSPSTLWTLDALGALVRMVSHLSPGCLPLHSGFFAHMISHLSPTCLPELTRCFCIASALGQENKSMTDVLGLLSKCAVSTDALLPAQLSEISLSPFSGLQV